MKSPPPNPMWEYTPPAVSKDGRVVRVDAMQLPMVLEMYATFKVKPVAESFDAAREHAAWLAKGKRRA